MTHAESFSQCASYRNNRRYYFGLFSYLNGNGNMPKQLTYNQFTEKLEKGDLKTLEIQPQQNVYMVSGKTKMMKTIHQLFYITTKKNYKKLLMLLKSKTV